MLSMKDLIQQGDLAGVQRAVQDDPDMLNALCSGMQTPLMVSCFSRISEPAGERSAIARWLIKEGADLDAQDQHGWTALMLTCRYDQLEAAKALIKGGASLDLQDQRGWTALMLACRYDQPEAAKALIQASANLNLQNQRGWTALMLACHYDQPKAAKALIKAGANVDLQDQRGWTALMLACRYDRPETAKALIEGEANLDLQDQRGWTALMLACRYNQPEAAKALIEGGANLDLRHIKGLTALMIACSCSQPDTTKALIEGGASLDLQNKDGWTALMFACQSSGRLRGTAKGSDLVRNVKLCYAGGADLFLINKDGQDALAMACRFKQTRQTSFLRFVIRSRVASILVDELEMPGCEVVSLFDKFLSKETKFSSTKIGDAGARALAEAIAGDTELTRLDLSDGKIGDAGAEAFAKALRVNDTLVELDLWKNAISDAGASVLANAMEHSTSLRKVWLGIKTNSPDIIERIHRQGLKAAIDGELKRKGLLPESGTTMATLQSLAVAAEMARAASTRYHDFFDDALSEIASILMCLDDPLAALRPFQDRVRAIQQQVVAFETLQKAVVADASLAASRDETRSEILEGIRSILADGFEAKVATLAAYTSPEDIQGACDRAWDVFFAMPFDLAEQRPTLEDVQTVGQALEYARKSWRARHDFTSLQSKTEAAIDAQVQELASDMRAVEQAFRAELEVLRTDDGMADAPFDEIRSVLIHLATFYAPTQISQEVSRWRDDLACVTAQLAHLSEGSTKPDVASLKQQLVSVRRARRAQERLKFDLDCARDDAESGALGAAEEVARLEAELAGTTSIFKLDREVCRARADVLHHAETHYPELLHDSDWCKCIGITDGALVGVGKLSLWLGDVTRFNFDVVQELASRPGKTATRVRDPDGRDLVLKRFHLGSKALYGHFYRQVQALAEIESPFVARIEGLFTDDSNFGCILMPFYPGGISPLG